jgi:hypothetical protein
MKQALLDFIHGILDKKYELNSSDNGYCSVAPSSIWLSKSNAYFEMGIIDRRSTSKNGAILPKPPKEALMWISFSPRHIVEAINNTVIQISPDLAIKDTLGRLTQIDNCTFTLDSIKSGTIKWKNLSSNK